MPLYIDQSAAAQTAFASVSQATRQHELRRSIADLPGSFAKKVVSGRTYWYYQVKQPDRQPQQHYVGPDDDETRALMAMNADASTRSAKDQLGRLCEAAIVLGGDAVVTKHARVLKRLADHGLFRAGAILVGTHAFLAYQNRLGVRWTAGHTTVDLDFAHPGRNISIALHGESSSDRHKAIESLRMGFLPVNDGTRYAKQDEPDFDLDFLTAASRDGLEPVAVPQLNVVLQPLRFMEFSMEDPVSAVLLSSLGPILVNVPRPERYATAKLLVYAERLEGQQPEKAQKDLAQAATLIDFLSTHQPEVLASAWEDLLTRGPGWIRRARQGFDALIIAYPDIACTLDAPPRRSQRASSRPS